MTTVACLDCSQTVLLACEGRLQCCALECASDTS